MDKLSLLRLFVAAVDHGGFAAAARHLGLSPSTLSKAIARLESDLEIKLFQRSTRQVSLSEAGRRYLGTARTLINDLDQCEQALKQSNDQPGGTIKLNLPVSYGRLYVLPVLGHFIAHYPEIKLDISFNDSYVDMLENGIDLSIRSGKLEDARLIARKLSPMEFYICASPAYLEKHTTPSNNNDLLTHPWIRFRYRQSGRLMPVTVVADGDLTQLNPEPTFVVDDGEALAELCIQGLGLTQIPYFIAQKGLESGALTAVGKTWRDENQGIYLVYPNREYLPEKVRVLVDFLLVELGHR